MKELLQKWEEYEKKYINDFHELVNAFALKYGGIKEMPDMPRPSFEGFMEWLKNEKSSD